MKPNIFTRLFLTTTVVLVLCDALSFTDWPGVVRTHQGEPATLSWKLDTSLDDTSETVSFSYPPITGSSDSMYTRSSSGTEAYHPDYQDRMTVSYTENNQRLGFTLDNVQEPDTRGQYECEVRVQGLAHTNSDARLFVYMPLSGPTLSPNPAQSAENRTFTLTCSATSTSEPADLRPGLSYTWSREGGSLPERHRVEGSEGERLVIDPVLKGDDKKTYRCDVREIGSSLNKFIETVLDVQYKPGTPTLQAADTQLVEGESLNLTCLHLAGNPAVYNYSWWNTDRSSVYTSTTNIRTFSDVTVPVHDGAWTCEVRNSVGASQSAQLRITVDAPPQIHDAPASRIEVLFNQTLSEVCQVKAKPRATVSWTHNGGSTLPAAIQAQNIADSPSDKYTISGSTLQWSPESSDSERRQAGGDYKCHGDNGVDPAISSHDINLIVLYGPVGITLSPPGPFTVIEGNEVTVTCNSDCSPTCTYTWTRSSDSWNHSGPELRFPTIHRTDHDTYTCQSVNDYGSKRISVVITVNFSTEWEEFRTSPEELFHGNDVTLTCSVNSRPDSVVVISRALTELSRSLNSETDYKFHPISILDSDVYKCSAGNGIGSNITDTEDLDVKGGFHFCEDQRESVSRGLPRNVDFEEQICQFANPFTDVSRSNWTFELLNETQKQTSLPTDVNITTAPADHNYKKMIVFHIPEITPEHYGTYKMTNGNEHGPDLVFTMFLTPEEPPEAPYGLTCTKTTSISLYLSWYAGYDGGPDQTFVLEYTNTATGDTYQVEIDGSEVLECELVSYKLVEETRVLPEQTYRIQISARNSKGLTPGPVTTNTTMASLEIENSSPTISIDNDKALITWEISNLEQVSHLTIVACDSNDDTNCETTNVTEPLVQPYIATLPPADNYVFLITFYDGIHVLASAEEEHIPGGKDWTLVIIGVVAGVAAAAIIVVILVVLWRKGILSRDKPPGTSRHPGGSGGEGFQNPSAVELVDEEMDPTPYSTSSMAMRSQNVQVEISPYGSTPATRMQNPNVNTPTENISPYGSTPANGVPNKPAKPTTPDPDKNVYSEVDKDKKPTPDVYSEIRKDRKPGVAPKPTGSSSTDTTSRPASVYPPAKTPAIYTDVKKDKAGRMKVVAGQEAQFRRDDRPYANVVATTAEEGPYSDVSIPGAFGNFGASTYQNAGEVQDEIEMAHSKPFVNDEGIMYAQLNKQLLDEAAAKSAAEHGATTSKPFIRGSENLVEYASIDQVKTQQQKQT